jgi:protein SCO1
LDRIDGFFPTLAQILKVGNFMQRRSIVVGGSTSILAVGLTASSHNSSRRLGGASWYTSIPNVVVWAHDGRKYLFFDDLVRGHVVVINFMFAGCGGICPLVTENLRRVQDLLGMRVGRDIFMYSITLWPELETPDVLRAYAEQHEVGRGWLLLTGAPPDVEHLRRGLGFVGPDPERDVIADEHTGMLRFGNAALDRWAGTPALGRPEWIVKAITSSMGLPAHGRG